MKNILLSFLCCIVLFTTLVGCNADEPTPQSWESFVSQTDTDYSGLTVSVATTEITTETTELSIVIDNQSAHDFSYCEADICLAKNVDGGFVRIPTGGIELAMELKAGDSHTVSYSLETTLSKGTYRIGLENCGAYTEFTVS